MKVPYGVELSSRRPTVPKDTPGPLDTNLLMKEKEEVLRETRIFELLDAKTLR